MFDPITITFELAKQFLGPYLKVGFDQIHEPAALIRAIYRAYEDLLKRAPDFSIEGDHLKDHFGRSLFENKAFIEEYLRYFSDSQFEDPDPEKLYAAYEKEVRYTAFKLLPQDSFEKIFGVFWTYLRAEIKLSEILKARERDRILQQMDAYVSSPEADQIIALYCEHQLDVLKKDFINKLGEGEDHTDKFWYVPNSIDRVLEGREKKREPVKSLEDEIITHQHKRIVLIGNAGVGKTIFMRHLEKECIATGVFAVYLHTADIESATESFLKEKIGTKLNQVLRYTSLNLSAFKMKGLINHLLRKRKIIFIIDAYDQVDISQVSLIHNFMMEAISNTPFIISTRPHRLMELKNNLSDMKFFVIKPFNDDQLLKYFGIRFPLETLLKQVPKDLVSIPLLAKLVKSLMLEGNVDNIVGKAALFEKFTEHLMNKQIKNDRRAKVKREGYFYDKLLNELSDLSLSLLLKGEKQYFHKKDAKRFYDHLFEMEETEILINMVKHILDIESKNDIKDTADPVEGKTHKYHHANFQEYFAARQLLILYEDEEHDQLFQALHGLTYDQQELGLFFSELISLKTNDPVKEVIFWHQTLDKAESDWVRTYAMQVRDNLARTYGGAEKWLASIFRKEDSFIMDFNNDENMVFIPKGKFLFGSYEKQNEWPVRLVDLKEDYEIDIFAVTNQMYCDFLNLAKPNQETLEKWIDLSGRYENEGCTIRKKGDLYIVLDIYDDHPVIYVTWYGAKAYADVNGLALPTEFQWEKAARGVNGRRYPWGNDFDENKSNSIETEDEGTVSVANYSSEESPYGCIQMAGNVLEWTNSWYDEDRKTKVIRGGSWYSSQASATCAFRGRDKPAYRYFKVGFRCIRTLK